MSPETKFSVARSDSGKILIVGGYGKVGLAIGRRLAPFFPGRVTIAGRNLDKARTAAAAVGDGSTACAMDIFAADNALALADVALVIVCLDQSTSRFAEQCLSRGINYVDISAKYSFLQKVENLDKIAHQNGATTMLSVGTSPGLTNMLARRVCEKMDRVDRIDILVELGLGDHHGQAAIEWTLDNLDAEYEVKEFGQPKAARSFGNSISMPLPGQRSGRTAYCFNFSDQQVIGHTLDVPSVATWMRFDSRVLTWIFARSAQAGLGRLLRRPWWRKFAVWCFMHIHIGSDICGIAVRGTGLSKNGTDAVTLVIVGREEAQITAVITAETARQMLTGTLQPGVMHSEQAIDLDSVISALKAVQPDLVVAL